MSIPHTANNIFVPVRFGVFISTATARVLIKVEHSIFGRLSLDQIFPKTPSLFVVSNLLPMLERSSGEKRPQPSAKSRRLEAFRTAVPFRGQTTLILITLSQNGTAVLKGSR